MIKEKFRDYWHDLYYKWATPSGEKFALTCREAVEAMNSAKPHSHSKMSWFRLQLHLSLCRACSYYSKAGQALAAAVKKISTDSKQSTVTIEKLNRELLEKYGG